MLTSIAIYSDPIEANVAKTKIQSEGMYYFLKNEELISSPRLKTIISEVELQVNYSDIDKAKKLLKLDEVGGIA